MIPFCTTRPPERWVHTRREQLPSRLVPRSRANHRYVRVGAQSKRLAFAAIAVAIAPVSTAFWHDEQIKIATKRDLPRIAHLAQPGCGRTQFRSRIRR